MSNDFLLFLMLVVSFGFNLYHLYVHNRNNVENFEKAQSKINEIIGKQLDLSINIQNVANYTSTIKPILEQIEGAFKNVHRLEGCVIVDDHVTEDRIKNLENAILSADDGR